MKQLFLGFACAMLGFGVSAVLFVQFLAPRYQKLTNAAEVDLTKSRSQVNDCVKRLDEAHAMNLVCTNQTKEALRLGEECTALLYYMPIDVIQQVRDKLLTPNGTFDTGSTALPNYQLTTPGLFDQ